VLRAGRGAGKTRSAAEQICDGVVAGRRRIALVGRSAADAREVMVEGESGVLACSPDGFRPTYEPSKRRLTWPNGAIATTYSAESGDQLRGPQHDMAWCDELAAWADAHKGDVLDTSWNNLMLGLRLGTDPRCIVTTTPRQVKLFRQIIARRSTVVTSASTYANLANLAPAFREQVLAAYEGTRIGRQELLGELLEDVEGALWTLVGLDSDRVTESDVPDLVRIVIGFDPAVTSNASSDESGIVVVGIDAQGHLYVLADYSMRGTPDACATKIRDAYLAHAADAVIVEVNNGGDYIPDALRKVDGRMAVKVVRATRGKRTRAEPVSMRYEQHRAHHVGTHPQLEDQMTSWVAENRESPDRVDALVWAATDLLAGGTGTAFLAHLRARESSGDLEVKHTDWAALHEKARDQRAKGKVGVRG
jgi:phage terminase large subunit-like protein